MKLSRLILGTKSPEVSINYYTNQLGMELINSINVKSKACYILRFPNNGNSISLELLYDKKNDNNDEIYQETAQDNYWKYSLFVDDIEQVYNELDNEYLKGKPYQFKDIGYLLHTKDAENYNIEYIQKYFKQNTKPTTKIDSLPLNDPPVFGLITLRTKDPLKTIKFYEHFFDLKFIERMYVDRGNGIGFTLYFLGAKHLQPPNVLNPDAIENREWLYQQKETFIELQYHWGTEQKFDFQYIDKSNHSLGLKALVFETDNLDTITMKLRQAGFQDLANHEEISQEKIVSLRSPDNHPIIIREI